MNFHGKDIKVFAANSHTDLARQIAGNLGLPVVKSDVTSFSDG